MSTKKSSSVLSTTMEKQAANVIRRHAHPRPSIVAQIDGLCMDNSDERAKMAKIVLDFLRPVLVEMSEDSMRDSDFEQEYQGTDLTRADALEVAVASALSDGFECPELECMPSGLRSTPYDTPAQKVLRAKGKK